MSRARDLIERFGRDEDAFRRSEFLAPVSPKGRVRVRLSGIVCELAVRDPRPGLQLLRPLSMREAEIVREASMSESARYLALFPRARLVAALPHGSSWLGLPAAAPPKGVRVEGLVPVALAPTLRHFETALVRFDGAFFVFERSERAAEAAYLREALERDRASEALERPGLTGPERAAYAACRAWRKEMEKSGDERRLERALGLAGAELSGFEPLRDAFTVRFRVDGVAHESVVTREDLTVVSAGICLSGEDRVFDLTSLVGVLREWREQEGE